MRHEEYKAIKDSGALKSAALRFSKALLLSVAIIAVVFALAALLLTYTSLPETLLGTIVIFTTLVSVVFGAAKAAHSAKSRGWLTGAVFGALYSLILYFVSSLAGDGTADGGYLVVVSAIALFSGAAGGILGINLPGKRKYAKM